MCVCVYVCVHVCVCLGTLKAKQVKKGSQIALKIYIILFNDFYFIFFQHV